MTISAEIFSRHSTAFSNSLRRPAMSMGDATGGIEEAHDMGSEIGPPQPHIDALVHPDLADA